MLRRDWFPPTALRGTRELVDIGSSGNAARERLGGAAFVFAPGPGTDVGRMTGAGDGAEAAADDDAHGVLFWPPR